MGPRGRLVNGARNFSVFFTRHLSVLLVVAVVARKVEQMHAMVVVMLFSALMHAVLAQLVQLFYKRVRLNKIFYEWGENFFVCGNIFE